MIHLNLELHAKPESLEMLQTALSQILPDTVKYEGCISVEILTSQENPLIIILSEKWESKEHQKNYFNWRAEKGDLATLASLLSKEPSLQFYDVTSV